MKDIGLAIRNLYSGLLAGITYAGQPVPFYDAEPWESAPDHYVVLQNIDHTETGNDQAFTQDANATLEIVTRQNMINSRIPADTIAGEILGRLLPTPYQDHYADGIQVMIRSANSPGYLHTQHGTVQINRKILVISNHLIQTQ
jgi:hypothetical protein